MRSDGEGAGPARAGSPFTGAQILWGSLARQGVDTVFGYPDLHAMIRRPVAGSLAHG